MKLPDKIRDRRALSQVVTTLILLVVSVLMASGTVTYYSIAVTSSSLRQEQLNIGEARIWVNASGAQAAVLIENVGGRDALIDQIEVRYSETPWGSVYHAPAVEGEITPAQGSNITGPFNHTIGNAALSFERASGSIVLRISEGIIIYIDQPDAIGMSDIGDLITVIVHTSANQYLALVDVKTA